ncbi:MAG TPA: hypothetical protein VK627_07085 [Edaphobacter sp.]|nr:hypothetical protein [Edaphobacter sp.]
MNSAVDDPCSTAAGDASDLVAAQGIAGVDADADDIAGLNGFRDDLLDGFVDEDGIARDCRSRCGQDKEPSGGDNGSTKGVVAGVYKMDANLNLPFLVRVRWIQRVALSNMRELSRAGMITDHDYSRQALMSAILHFGHEVVMSFPINARAINAQLCEFAIASSCLCPLHFTGGRDFKKYL